MGSTASGSDLYTDLVWVCTKNWLVSPDYRRGCLRGPHQEKVSGYWQYQDQGGPKTGHEHCGWFTREEST